MEVGWLLENPHSYFENYQQKDGSITIPKVLRPYMNDLERFLR